MISVCMAVFNGEKYIETQVLSILAQLNESDELIIVDDCSTDSSLALIENLNSIQIRVFKNNKNIGHVKTFERAITLADGDIIFLSDQDDIWEMNKVESILRVFKENKNTIIVHHEVSYFSDGIPHVQRVARPLKYGHQHTAVFVFKQLYKAQIFGCAVAFKKSLLKHLLPFPKFCYAHDHWFAICAPFFGAFYMIPDELVRYRQHSHNVTPKQKNSKLKILRLRLMLLYQFFTALIRKAKYVIASV